MRKQAAEQLYVRLMTAEDTGPYTEESIDAAADVLVETAWDGSLDVVKAARIQLLQIFELDVSEPKTAPDQMQKSAASSSKRDDENASYQALINDGSRL